MFPQGSPIARTPQSMQFGAGFQPQPGHLQPYQQFLQMMNGHAQPDGQPGDSSMSYMQRSDPITTASVPIHKLPKVHLSECVEYISQGIIDATLSSNLSPKGLGVLVWLFSKVRPDLKLTDLRVKTYSRCVEGLRRQLNA